jgi:hypothetical protein
MWHGTPNINTLTRGVRGGAIGRGTALQEGRSRVRLPMVFLIFLIDLILTLGYAQGLSLDCKGGRDKVITFMCRLSENPGSLNLLDPSGFH